MNENANGDYHTAEAQQVENQFVALKELCVTMSRAVNDLEKRKNKFKDECYALTQTNKSLQDSNNKLLRLNEQQRKMIRLSLNKTTSLKTELDRMKKENLKLINYSDNDSPKIISKSSSASIDNYKLLFQNKIEELEKQLLENEELIKQKSSLHCVEHEKKLSQLEIENSTLRLENKSLNEQITKLRNLHQQIASKIRSKNQTFTDKKKRPVKNHPRKLNSPILIEDDKPVQVYVIDSD